jgi:hypothetical protein
MNEPGSIQSKPVLFIVGVGRSGTSLLQSMLGSHKKICFLPETQFLRKYLFHSKKNKAINKKGFQEFKNILKSDSAFKRLNISPNDCVNENEFSVYNVYEQILKIHLLKCKKEIPGDKDPRNLDFIKAIHKHFSEARVLHIIRDPRDVILSRTKADWSKKWPLFLHTCMYNTQLIRARQHSLKLFNTNYFELFYEDLIEKPEAELRKICEWLNISYDPCMQQYQEVAKSLVSTAEMQWKKETLGPLLSKNKEKWKKDFSPYQVALIESICKTAWKKLPYKKANYLQLSFFEKLKINFAVCVSKLFYIFYPLRLKFL